MTCSSVSLGCPGFQLACGPNRIVARRFLCQLNVHIRPIKIAYPIPNISAHVVKPISVWRERPDRRGSYKFILAGILVRKLICPCIGHVFPVGLKLIAPGVSFALESAFGSKFPLRLGRQSFPSPFCIGDCIVPRDLHDGVIFPT